MGQAGADYPEHVGDGASTLIFLAGLQDIPASLLDAASIDGANAWQRFRNVTLPLLSPVILFNLVMVVVVAVLALAAIVLLASGHNRRGTYVGALALVLALTVVDLVTFYFNQFYTVGSALFQLSLLAAVEWYRWRLDRHGEHHSDDHAAAARETA